MNNNQPNKPKKPKPGEAGGVIPHVNPAIAITAIVIFSVLLVLPTLIWGGIYATEAIVDDVINPIIEKTSPDGELIELNLIEDLSPDTGENRAMAQFPTTFDPAVVTVQIENWYNDNLPFRSIVYNSYKNATNNLEKLYEQRSDADKPSLREQLMEMFPTASQITPPGGDVVLPPDFVETESSIGQTEIETEESLPPFEETLPPFEETVPPVGEDETLPPFEGIPDFPPIDQPEGDGGNESGDGNGGENGGGDSGSSGNSKCQHEKGEGVVETPSTCTEFGVMMYYCTKCNVVMDGEYLPKADHVKGEGVVEVEPTCHEYGVVKYYCQNCNKYLQGEHIAKLKHNYALVSDDSNRLCGYYYDDTYECSLCKDTYTETVLKKHKKGKRIKEVEASYTTYGYDLVKCRDCGGEYRMNIEAKLVDNSPFTPYSRSAEVYEGRYKWLFYRGNNSEAYFRGTNLMSNAELADYYSTLTKLNDICEAKGIKLQICIWPNKDQVYPEYMGINPSTQNKRMDRFVSYMKANSDVRIIYPLAELKSVKQYYDTYLKYDTHWNCVGGFVGYQEMLKSLGLQYYDIRNMPVFEYTGVETENLDPYYRQISGDMISLGGLSSSEYNGDHNYYVKYFPEITVNSKDGVDHGKAGSGLDGAEDTRHTTSKKANYDLNFVMLADSYRVMQLGYLEKDFSDCFLTHRDRVNDADVMEAVKNADILVIAGVERLEPSILATAKRIIEILSE